ncbi:MAG: succinylglutamate desuccinylase/aspartoacylase family protein [Bacteroidia bacterium]
MGNCTFTDINEQTMISFAERIIGKYTNDLNGPVLFFLGGIHGNEPAGVLAIQRVFEKLNAIAPPFHGKCIGIAGNLPALRLGVRYIECDLNRLWSASERDRIYSSDRLNTEETQQREIMEIIETEACNSSTPVIIADLHTTSASRGFFSIVTYDAENIRLASSLYAPVILKMTDSLTSTTNIFMKDRQFHGLTFEAGQHDDPASVDNHEAAIWLLMEAAGCIESEYIPGFEAYRNHLISEAAGLPRYVEVIYRHGITPEDEYETSPGFANYSTVKAGEIVAKDKRGPVTAPADGMMLMPLYQKQGDEGFFLIRELDQQALSYDI